MRERIAVATRDGKSVNAHFGKTPFFFVFDVEDGEITLESRSGRGRHRKSIL